MRDKKLERYDDGFVEAIYEKPSRFTSWFTFSTGGTAFISGLLGAIALFIGFWAIVLAFFSGLPGSFMPPNYSFGIIITLIGIALTGKAIYTTTKTFRNERRVGKATAIVTLALPAFVLFFIVLPYL
jgi:hypothetical protein